MFDFEKASEIALNEISKMSISSSGDEIILLNKYTIEKEYGWVFFYGSKLFEETKNIKYALAGNAPFIVDKFKNEIHYTGTALEIEEYLEEYEEINRIWKLEVNKRELDIKENVLRLKKVFDFQLKDILLLKKSNTDKVSIIKGGRNNLLKFQELLNASNIETEVILNVNYYQV